MSAYDPLADFDIAPSPKPTPFRDVPWTISDVVLGLAPMLLFRFLPFLIAPGLRLHLPRWIWIPLTALNMAWLLAFPLSVRQWRGAGLPGVENARRILVEGMWGALAWLATVTGLILVFSIVLIVLGPDAMPSSPLEPIATSPDWFEAMAFRVMAILVAPFAEEVFFRGMVYNALRQRMPVYLALPIQAAVFGFMHPFDVVNSSAVALVGLALGILYEWRKTLAAPICLHMLFNGMSVLAITLGLSGSANAPVLGVYGETAGGSGGCRITVVVNKGSAEIAGVRVGDVITAVDGHPVASFPALTRVIRSRKVGDKVKLDILRDGRHEQVEVVLKSRQEVEKGMRNP
jgi:membrane protease YdiL (CAAX protease family)